MSNLFWYISIAVFGVGVAALTIFRKRQIYKASTLFVFYLFAASITWIGEFIALGAFEGYAYKPGLFVDPWAENLTGHLLLNTTIWPGGAILMVAYSFRYVGMSFITAFFIFAEYLFVQLKIYEQHWWKYYMSIILVIAFLSITKMWFSKINPKCSGLPRVLTFYFVGFLIIHMPAPILLLLGKQHYSLDFIQNIVANLSRTSIIFILIYHLLEAILLVFFVCVLKKWFWKLVPFVIAFLGQGILAKMNILVFQNGWNLLYTDLIYAICLAVFILIEQYTLKPKKPLPQES